MLLLSKMSFEECRNTWETRENRISLPRWKKKKKIEVQLVCSFSNEYGVTLGPYPIPKPNNFTLIMSDNEELIWTICVCYNNGMACSLFWEEKDFTGHIRRTFWAWCRQRYWQFLFHIAKRLHLTSSIYSIGWMELNVSEAGHENWPQISRKSGIMTFKNFSKFLLPICFISRL